MAKTIPDQQCGVGTVWPQKNHRGLVVSTTIVTSFEPCKQTCAQSIKASLRVVNCLDWRIGGLEIALQAKEVNVIALIARD